MLDENISARQIGFQIGHATRQAPSAKRAHIMPRTPAKRQGKGFPGLYASETGEPFAGLSNLGPGQEYCGYGMFKSQCCLKAPPNEAPWGCFL